MWGLEYALLFGLPSNKLELFDGRTRLVFPFRTRGEGEAHLEAWTETLRRWKNIAAEPVVRKGRRGSGPLCGMPAILVPRLGLRMREEYAAQRATTPVWSDRAAWDWGEK